MARLTEEEAYALDDFVTNNEITLGPDNTDWLTHHALRAVLPLFEPTASPLFVGLLRRGCRFYARRSAVLMV